MIRLKRYVEFSVSFVLAFIMLQVVSGAILTMLYTPSFSWIEASALSSEVEFGHLSIVPTIVMSIVAFGIAYGVTKLSNKKIVG
ncbi:hypothetical protein [Lederbergia lenta]|uniref:Uncharacterized protein n=1 Tax=Lederbergia lenta TaxID=1467 RepID=A0A2X4VRU8_LEDLE|nr:hypothetical protein [Lederbergia lenta]MCM3110794.1 hypothetical protein [Lederbergia lenta]MEC2325811.1 hypothetical protein [Lederbergia lenta]SQI53713.1 Uncharacterised protein [Lederbergia lenta]